MKGVATIHDIGNAKTGQRTVPRDGVPADGSGKACGRDNSSECQKRSERLKAPHKIEMLHARCRPACCFVDSCITL